MLSRQLLIFSLSERDTLGLWKFLILSCWTVYADFTVWIRFAHAGFSIWGNRLSGGESWADYRYRLYVRVYVPLQISIISITLFLVMLDGPRMLRGVM
jgi:hypothetical protein